MEIILTHNNMDFDALASLVAASKLYPDAVMVLPSLQSDQVKQYLAIYRDSFAFTTEEQVNWDQVTHIILTDVHSLERTAAASQCEKTDLTVYDHHTLSSSEKQNEDVTYHMHQTGAAVTILLEEIMNQRIELTTYEATLFALGLYTDTGSFTHPNTTIRDLKAAAFLMEQGMQLDIVQQFSAETLSREQQHAFQSYLQNIERIELEGLDVVLTTFLADTFVNSLNSITSRVLETTGADAVISLTSMKNKTFIIGRSVSDRLDLRPLMKQFNGGGHAKAASANIKNGDIDTLLSQIKEYLPNTVLTAVEAASLMSAPVKTVHPETTIDEAKQQMHYYGHNGFPVTDDDGRLKGIISRRDIDKAKQHGYGHSPVKAYMSTQPVTISQNTSFEKIQQLMIQHNIGRLPVIHHDKMIGIVSRTDIIEYMHHDLTETNSSPNIRKQMEQLLSASTLELLKSVGKLAEERETRTFIIGGIVRDLIMGIPNEDVDIVVEGNGIEFAEYVAEKINGVVKTHETFGTATVETAKGTKLDFTTSRTEYYEKPASLPTVIQSNIKEDLYRRDFTMNAIAASLQPEHFGELIDHFHGVEDIKQKRLRVLHNLSFVEDPTRILRGIRFEERFDFKMDQQTEAFLRQSVSSIAALSQKRVITELRYLFAAADPPKVIQRLDELEVLDSFLPGAKWDEHTAAVLENFLSQDEVSKWNRTGKEFWFYVVLCLYTNDLQQLALAKTAAETKQQKQMTENVIALLEQVTSSSFTTPGSLHEIAEQIEDNALLVAACILQVKNKDYEQMRQTIDIYRKKRKELTHLISGKDLKEAGIPPGPSYKHYLFQMEQAILDGVITNRKEALTYLYSKILP